MAEENELKWEGKEPKEEEQPKRSSLKLIIIGVLVIILGAGGYLGWDLFLKESKDKEQISEETRPQEEKIKGIVTYPLDTFIVNLMDKSRSGKKYLKATMILEIGKQEQTMILDQYKPQLTDTILILLSSKSFDEISTIEGKLGLKRALLSRINQILGDVVARRIYFKEFVVQ
ncbi:MAG: flagellar basal body-associated FliL family protein [Deltaproteobacteria bacterium]|nr:flagellar basal body-associated FliL family protein [Deltaproteobacteria bacterium]